MACEVGHCPNPSEKPKFWCHAILAADPLKNTFRHYTVDASTGMIKVLNHWIFFRRSWGSYKSYRSGQAREAEPCPEFGEYYRRLPKMACAGMMAQLLTTLSSGLVGSHMKISSYLLRNVSEEPR